VATLTSLSGQPVSYEAEEDLILTGVVSYGNAIVSLQKGFSFADWQATLVGDSVSDHFFMFLNANLPLDGLNFEIPRGQIIVYSPQNAGTVGHVFLATSADLRAFL
jgi:hypothetical protein